MKRVFCLIGWAITFIITAGLVVFIYSRAGWQLTSFGLFFIVPVGSIIVGAGISTGYGFIAGKLNKKLTGIDWILVLFLTLLAVYLMYFTFYSMTSVDNNGKIIYSFTEGNHISGYTIEGSEQPMNFINFMKNDIGSRQITFYTRYTGSKALTLPRSTTVGWIDFIIELIGYLLGATVITFVFTGDYCDKCGVYHQCGDSTEIDVKEADRLVARIEESRKRGIKIDEVFKGITSKPGTVNIRFEKIGCPKCGDGIFITKFNAKDNKGDRKELNDLEIKLKMRGGVITGGEYRAVEIIKSIKEEMGEE